MVYFVQAGPNGPIKIGFTAGSPSARVAALQTGNHVPLRLVAVIEGDQSLERSLHERFAEHRGTGEWFNLCPELCAHYEREELGITAIEFSQLVEEVATEIVSRREHAAAEVLVQAEPEDADWPWECFPEPEFDAEAIEGVA